MKADLPDHRKFLRLVRLLGEPTPHVIGYLELMWRRCYQTGNPKLGDELDVEAAAGYQGEPGKFARAAADSGGESSTGFIVIKDGAYHVHDLWDHAPEWAKKRMARTGNLPEGVADYGGIKPHKKRRAADKSKDQPPRGDQNGDSDAARHTEQRGERGKGKEEKRKPFAADAANGDSADTGGAKPKDRKPAKAVEQKPAQPRERNPLFDAIADVCGLDVSTAGSLVGSVAAALKAAETPYTPDDVREFGHRFAELCPWASKDSRLRPTAKEVERYIGGIRASPPVGSAKPGSPPAGDKFAAVRSKFNIVPTRPKEGQTGG